MKTNVECTLSSLFVMLISEDVQHSIVFYCLYLMNSPECQGEIRDPFFHSMSGLDCGTCRKINRVMSLYKVTLPCLLHPKAGCRPNERPTPISDATM
jgi:hypothetical protein